MPDFDYTPLTELTELTATSANSRFTGAANTINNLPAEAVAPKCFQAAHLPSVVVEEGAGVSHRWVLGSGTPPIHTYSEPTMTSGVFQVVSSNGDAGGGTTATLTFANPVALANGGPIAGILVMADINMQSLSKGGGANTDAFAGFRIAWQQGGGSWTGIARSERYINDRGVDSHSQHIDANIRTLIVASDNATIDAVRLEVCVIDLDTATGTHVSTVLRQCHITALVIRSEKN